MSEIQKCPNCGATIDPSQFDGLCPHCIVSIGLGAANGRTVVDTTRPIKPSAEFQVGQPLGAYRLMAVLGRGGMGDVYEAEHRESGRRVALKVMNRALASESDRKRFLREGRLAASVSHPNTVYIYGSEEIDGVAVICMELVPGGNLHERVKREGPMAVTEAIEAMLQVIDGLEAASDAGVLHRDIKPANCFLSNDGAVKIGDFGLSISTLAQPESLLTAPGTMLGTPAFASPEQLRGEDLDVRSDIYSVGATLYYLLTGKAPFAAAEFARLIADVLEKPPIRPDKVRPEIPRALGNVILRCFSKERSRRYADYERLRRALVPFTAAALDPATLGIRSLAGFIDCMIISAISAALAAAAIYSSNGATALSSPEAWGDVTRVFNPASSLAAFVWFWAVVAAQVVYFAVPEWRWGASPAKMLLSLRVMERSGRPLSFGRATSRSCAFLVPPALMQMACCFIIPSTAGNLQFSAVSLSLYLWTAFLAVTMRRRNGYAELHDLLSGTRVTKRFPSGSRTEAIGSTAAARHDPHQVPPEIPPNAPRLGPYVILHSLKQWRGEELLLGYDEVLRREVWIHRLPCGSPPVPLQRQSLSSATRLRWLMGQRGTECWDAYEAPAGQPLLKALHQPYSWAHVRFWLSDLAQECRRSLNSVPALFDLNRVWIAPRARALLLDFPCPCEEQALLNPETPQNWVKASFESMQAFLSRMAEVALGNRSAPELNLPATCAPIPVPVHARPFLSQLRQRAFKSADALLQDLSPLLEKAGIISRRRRLAMVLTCLASMLLPSAVLIPAMRSMEQSPFSGTSQGGSAIKECLQELAADNGPSGGPERVHVKEALEICIANRLLPVITNTAWQDYSRERFTEQDQAAIDKLMARHRQRTTAEVEDSKRLLLNQGSPVVKAWLAKWRSEETTPPLTLTPEQRALSYLSVALAAASLLVSFPSLLLSFACRGGMVLHAFGLAVVRNDGSKASRYRILWRTVLVWYLPTLVLLLNWSAANGLLPPVLRFDLLLLVAFVAGGVWSVWKPNRGWQDLVARTLLVPK